MWSELFIFWGDLDLVSYWFGFSFNINNFLRKTKQILKYIIIIINNLKL